MLRVAGLPIEVVGDLRCAETAAWAEQLLRSEDELRDQGNRLSDRLGLLIGAREDGGVRRALLGLRRAVFNGRIPANAGAAADLVNRLDPAVGAALEQWLRARGRHDEMLAAGPDLLAGEIDRTRDHLRRLLDEEVLRSGLLLASPALDAQLDGFAAGDARTPDKRRRKVERTVLAYLYRTACKTSPFSSFTAVALGEVTAEPDPAGWDVVIAPGRTGHPQLNVIVLQRLAELILADPERRRDLMVSPASGWGREDDRVRFVRRSLTAGANDSAVTFDAVSDQLFFLRRSGALERMLGLFDHRPAMRYRELIDWLIAAEQATYEVSERYLGALLSLGMLQVPSLSVDVHSTDPLRDFCGSLFDIGAGWATQLAQTLQSAVSCIDGYPVADVAGRREALRTIARIMRLAEREITPDPDAESVLPQTMLYEDVRSDTAVTRDEHAWHQLAVPPLRSLEQILPTFDITLPQKLTLKGFFLARHGRGGRCDDLLKLVHEFHEDFFDEYLKATAGRRHFDETADYEPELDWLGLPDIAALDAARRAFVTQIRRIWDDRGGADEIVLTESAINDVADRLPPAPDGVIAQSHFLQLSRRGDRSLLVHNGSYAGLSFAFSRFTPCFDRDADPAGEQLAARLRRSNRQLQPPGVVFAEITGGPATSNLNLHGRLTDYEIVGPGESGSMPAEFQIPLDDLFLEHDPAVDRLVLRSRRLACQVIPVYLGYLVPQVLPAIPRTLILLSPTSMPAINVWGGVPEGPAAGGVTSRPRVRLGDLVLSRRSWTVRAADLPARGMQTTSSAWFLQWHRWRHQHGLPARVFATRVGARPTPGGRSKPQFVDFDSYLSLTALDALLTDPDLRLRFAEMLPGTGELHVHSDRGAHVAELVVETLRVNAASRGEEEPGQ